MHKSEQSHEPVGIVDVKSQKRDSLRVCRGKLLPTMLERDEEFALPFFRRCWSTLTYPPG